jgi:hypothetical protein
MPMHDDPEEVARQAFTSIGRGDWNGLLPLVAPAARQAIKAQAVALAESAGSRRPATREEVRSRQPDLPLAVAEWFAEQERRAMAAEEPAGLRSLGVGSIDELRSLPDDEVFVRWMTATDPVERTRRLSGHPADAEPTDRGRPGERPLRQHVVLGCVREGDAAHVVYRVEGYLDRPQVETLQRTPDGWRLGAEGVISRALRTFLRPIPPSP